MTTTCKVKDCDEGVLLLYEEDATQRDPQTGMIDPQRKVIYLCCPVCHEESTKRQKQSALFTYFAEHGIEPADMVPVAKVLTQDDVALAGLTTKQALEAFQKMKEAASTTGASFRSLSDQLRRLGAASGQGNAGASSHEPRRVGAMGAGAGGNGSFSTSVGPQAGGLAPAAAGGGGGGGAASFQSAPDPRRMVASGGLYRGIPVEVEAVQDPTTGMTMANLVRVEKDGSRTVLAQHAMGQIIGPNDMMQVNFGMDFAGGPAIIATVGKGQQLNVVGRVEFEE